MTGMARAMGTSLMGAQELISKNKNFWLTVSWTYILRPIQPLSAMLHQHSALISWRASCASTIKYYDKTVVLWHNRTARCCDRTRTLACHVQDFVLSHVVGNLRLFVLLRFRQEDFSENLVETSLSPWLLESDLYAQFRIQGSSLGQLHPQTYPFWYKCANFLCLPN